MKYRYIKEEVMELIPQLRIGQKVTVCYNGEIEKMYLTCTGKITQINNYWKYLVLGDVTIGYAEIEILAIPK